MTLGERCFFLLLIAGCLIAVDCAKPKTDLLLDEYGSLGTKAAFYDDEFLGGLQTNLETDGPCKNLPKRWRNKARSVDTFGTCILACTEVDCEGTCVRVWPAYGDQQLKTVQLAEKISSMKSCFRN